jgi:proteic killer suppression protein
MIRSFNDRYTEELYRTGLSRRFPSDIIRRARTKLEYIELAKCVEDLRLPTSNRLHSLAGDRAGQYSISINDQWRICFRFEDGDALEVEITDYH